MKLVKTKIWKHKETGQEYQVRPWWECIDGTMPSEMVADENDEWPDRMFAFGNLVQVGWLIKNEHGVWFGTNHKVKECFDEIGEIDENTDEEEEFC